MPVEEEEVLLQALSADESGVKDTYRARAAAIEASMDGIAILAEDETYDYLNHAHAAAYGYESREPFYEGTWRMCYDDQELERFENEVMPTLYTEGEWRGEATGVRADGSTFPQELSLSLSPNGRVVCVVRDISERKQREAELQRQTERLEEFSRLLTHDLRNPLAVAKAQAEFLDTTEGVESDHLDSLRESLDRIDELITDALDYAKTTEGVAQTDMETISLGEMVATSWETVATREATVAVESTTTVTALRTRLQQVFENLFRNAIEHAGAEATVWCGALPDDAGFYVEDDGPGIPPEQRQEVFDVGHSSKTEGTGYGLASVRRIVEDHGWAVTVTGGRTGGARFEVRTRE